MTQQFARNMGVLPTGAGNFGSPSGTGNFGNPSGTGNFNSPSGTGNFGSSSGTGYGMAGDDSTGMNMMGMNPLTNDQPLSFSGSKDSSFSMGGTGDSSMNMGNNDKGDSGNGADGNNYGASTNWQQQQGMMNQMGMGMMPGMMQGFDNTMAGNMAGNMAAQFGGFDPNMAMGMGMGMGMGMYPQQQDMSMRETIYLKESTLFPPPPNAPMPATKERPPGCRTVFVGGLPENANEAIMREVFERCGEINSYRQGRRNFCHIRFSEEMHIDNALYLSGYRMRIGEGTDSKDTGRLHVDFASARDDQYEFECKQRRLAREMRHQQVALQPERPPSPPPLSVLHYTEHEAGILNEQLKGEESFAKATSQLITWLERGDCGKRSAHSFYGMIQCVNSHVRRLMTEKQQYDEDLRQAKAYHNQRVTGILMQFTLIEQVFNSASKQRAWDHFTKAQRKNLDLWRKQAKELKANQQEELGLAEKGEEDMDMSDNEDEKPRGKREAARAEVITIEDEQPDLKRIKLMAAENELMTLKEENMSMQCQIEAYKNEVEIMKGDKDKYSEERETQIKALQHALVGMQQQLMEAKAKLRKEEEAREAKEAIQAAADAKKPPLPESESSLPLPPATPEAEKKVESTSDAAGIQPPGTESPTPAVTPIVLDQQFSPITVNLKEREALLVGFMATFLHVHPFGASVEYLWSYLQRLDPTTTSSEIDVLLNRFSKIFKQELFGCGATLEKRWKFVGFTMCLDRK